MLDSERAKSPAFLYGTMTAFCAFFSMLLWPKFGNTPIMAAFPQVFAVAALMPVLFYFIATMPREKAVKLSAISSCIIWVLGFGLMFVIPKTSIWVYICDAFLLFGFFPVLFLWRFSWTWLIFGALNVAIGFLLQMSQFMPDDLFPPNVLPMKHHLVEYHPPIVWWLSGLLALVFGGGRLIKNIYLMIRKTRSAE